MLTESIVKQVEKLVSCRFSNQYRDDARQDILCALHAGETDLDRLDGYIGRLVRRNEGERRSHVQLAEAERLTERDVERLQLRGFKPFVVSGQVIRKVSSYRRAVTLYREGKSIREVRALLGLSMTAASKFRKLALENFTVVCKCGLLAGHRGWCSWRYQNSPKRQEFMKRWHP